MKKGAPASTTPRVATLVPPAVPRRTARRRRARNRRPANWPKRFLWLGLALLVAEAAAALRFSPRFFVEADQVGVSGCRPELREEVARHLGPVEGNLFLLPVDALQRAARELPAVADVQVRRRLPNRVDIVVRERVAYANLATDAGGWFVVDRHLVPFRRLDAPAPGLPTIRYGLWPSALVVLGQPAGRADEVEALRFCLGWARRHPEFPLGSLSIDRSGKMCLNRMDGVPVHLGSSERLDAKLESLSRLLEDPTDLPSSDRISTINLFADGYPAVLVRKTAAATKQEP